MLCKCVSGDCVLLSSSKEDLRWFFRMERESVLLATSGLQLRCRITVDSSRLRRFFRIPCFRLVVEGSSTLGEKVTGGVLLVECSNLLLSCDTFRFKIDTGPTVVVAQGNEGLSTIIEGISSSEFFFSIENSSDFSCSGFL